MLSINHTSTASIRLSILRTYCQNRNKILYITDTSEDISMARIFARELTGKDWKEISSLAGFWDYLEKDSGYFFMSIGLLRHDGNLVHLERGSGLTVRRGDTITEEGFIESLISLGYIHGDASDTPGTYIKSGGTLTLRDTILNQRVQLEWFDTEIDSIILHHGDIRKHVANIRISARDDKVTLKKGEGLNPILVELLRGKIDENSKIGVRVEGEMKAKNEEFEEVLEINENSKTGVRGEGAVGTKMITDKKDEQSEEEGVGLPHENFGTFGYKSTENGVGKVHEKESEFLTKGFKNDGENGDTGLLRASQGREQLIILSGGDFLPEKETLLEYVDVHMGDFTTPGGMSIDGSIPEISSIIELEQLLRDTTLDTHIYSRYQKTILDFLEYNSIAGIRVTEVSSSKLMSGMWTDEDGKHLIIADDILGQIFVKKRTKKSIAKHLDLLLTLKPGDYIVHREHGIALFHSVVKKTLGEIEREYLELHYAEGDKLFVPLTEIYRVSRYIGDNHPDLTRLSGTEWERTMEKTNEEIEAIAADILETSAKRTLAKGRAFGVFREEEKLFQEAFAYTYTLDQKSAIDDIFADMESESPMDRLISGDVGFGKTEVAMNAIYKAVLSGTQVAVLSPLLVLADEHYETFCARLAPFGLRVGVLTRMSSPSEIKNTLDAMKSGTVDVVVGTHRLISDDVTWKRLGLLIIDEEHKFGVTHKEKIKKIKANLDILSLSATPIPRSLNLALSGLKKISILATPPARKKPIETIVTRWNEGIIREAITHELGRGGQIIIIHNRIRGMESMEKEIENIIENEEGKVKNKSKKDNSNLSGFGGENLSKNSSIKNNIQEEFSSSESEQNIVEQSEGGASFSSPDSFGTFATKSTETGVGKEGIGFQTKALGNDGNSGLLRASQGREPSEPPRIIITHGQMPAEHIEERIHAFKKREYDILLTTTIIENGVNFLSANTIIIIDPEEFGLASLHQLRGRVGRKDIDGRCYLMYRKPELAGDEKERLITIANNTHLGAGFEIAMRDMEIRGAGDVLGIKQAGKSKDIGLTLYFRMLEEKVEELKNARKTRKWTKIELELSYVIGDEYFNSEADKLSFYREIENIETLEELEEMESDLGTQQLKEMKQEGKKDANSQSGVRGEGTVGTKTIADKKDEQSEEEGVGLPLETFGTFGYKSTENGVGKSIQNQNISNLFLLLHARILLSEYGIEKLSKVGMNYTFDFVDGTDGTRIRSFLDRFDRKKNYVLLSMKKVRVETRYYKSIVEFLESLR